MPETIHVTADAVRSDPTVEGLEIAGTEWRLDVDRYGDFVVAATDIAPSEGLSASDCYRIGNRLQALVEERKRQGEWDRALVDGYPDVDSLDEFLWVIRFFLTCHECTDAGDRCFSPGDADEARVSTT